MQSYTVSVVGPGINYTLEAKSVQDIEIVESMLGKIKKDLEKKKRYLNNLAIIGAPTGHGVKALAEFAATHTNKIEVVTVEGLRDNFYAALTQEDIDKLGNAINKGLKDAGLLPDNSGSVTNV